MYLFSRNHKARRVGLITGVDGVSTLSSQMEEAIRTVSQGQARSSLVTEVNDISIPASETKKRYREHLNDRHAPRRA